jgi:DNA-directed RNA polymerase specialized sigma24 family protein
MAAFDASLENLYTGFLDRDPDKSKKFRSEISGFCTALIRRYGWSLPHDVQDEIVGETLCALLSPSARSYDPARGTFKEYLTGFVLNASRRLRDVLYPSLNRAKTVTEESGDTISSSSKILTLEEAELAERAHPLGVERGLMARIQINELLTAAPPMIRSAIEAVYIQEEPLSGFAARHGISRFALKRRMNDFVAHYSRPSASAAGVVA